MLERYLESEPTLQERLMKQADNPRMPDQPFLTVNAQMALAQMEATFGPSYRVSLDEIMQEIASLNLEIMQNIHHL